jgi:hypothetical protein
MSLSNNSNVAGESTQQIQDVALLMSIFWREQATKWQNIAHAHAVLRPAFSSLAIDVWDVPPGNARVRARRSLYDSYPHVLSLFSRVLFLQTGARKDLDRHIKSSPSLRLNWESSFVDAHVRMINGGNVATDTDLATMVDSHTEGFPSLIINLDTDVRIPLALPLDVIARLLASQPVLSWPRLASLETEARERWVFGRTQSSSCDTACRADPSMVSFVAPHVSAAGYAGEPWRAADAQRKVLTRLGRIDSCCKGGPINAPKDTAKSLRAARAQLFRSPYCPSSRFTIMHRNSLPWMYAMWRVWREAFSHSGPNRTSDLRAEYVGCSLMAPEQAVLLVWYRE